MSKLLFMKTLSQLIGIAIGLFFSTQVNAQFSTSGSNTTTTNNVGIGTTNPLQKLDVRGSALIGGPDLVLGQFDGRNQGSNLGNRALVHGFNDDLILNFYGDFEGGVQVHSAMTINERLTVGGSDLVLGTNDGRNQGDALLNRALVHGFNDELVVNFGGDFEGGTVIIGKVGIGTSSPQNELSVNGTIWAKKVRVRLTDAADWVFNEDYELRPLEEVKTFISRHKHLPEIPSAAEFRANDMEVSEMTNKLLQKIEELTLYTIAQEEKLQVQEEELKKMTVLEARLVKLESLLDQN